MGRNSALVAASLVTLALMAVHMGEDALHSRAGVPRTGWLIFVAIAVVMLLGTFQFLGRRSGYVIVLLGGLLALAMVLVHVLAGGAARWGGLFVASLVALALSGVWTIVVAARSLWRERASAAAQGL